MPRSALQVIIAAGGNSLTKKTAAELQVARQIQTSGASAPCSSTCLTLMIFKSQTLKDLLKVRVIFGARPAFPAYITC